MSKTFPQLNEAVMGIAYVQSSYKPPACHKTR